jgi:hypothetical protein
MKIGMFTVVLAIVFSPLAFRQAHSADGKAQDTQTQTIGRKGIEALITQLWSPNKDPNPNFDPWVSFPKDYDFKAQDKVEEAHRKLIQLGKNSFPVLIEHLNDKAYSMSISTAIPRSLSVGDVCFMIIENQVDPFASSRVKGRRGSDGKDHAFRGYFSKYCDVKWYSREGLQKWWQEHKEQSLKDMQIEALRWDIEDERRIGFVSKEDEEESLRPLQEKLNQLMKR